MKLLNIYNQLLTEGMQTISMQHAVDKQMFGPVYHGTSDDNRDTLYKTGFDVNHRARNGYDNRPYAMGYPAPIHHLGCGVYLTTVKAIAIQYNGNTTKGLKQFYIDCPRLETINFGSNNNMMKWWLKSGFDGELAKTSEEGRVEATKKMTDNLSSQFDAVWFKGKALYRLLDGDQICVFDPKNIYLIDPKLSGEFEIGSKVVFVGDDMVQPVYKHTHPNGYSSILPSPTSTYSLNGGTVEKLPDRIIVAKGTRGIIQRVRKSNDGTEYYEVKFTKGGTQYNIRKDQIAPVK